MVDKPDPLQTLVAELTQGLADLVLALEAGNLDAIRSAGALLAAIQAERQQAPAQIHIMPAPEPKETELRVCIHGINGAPDRFMTITKT